MKEEAFRKYLKGRKVSATAIESSVAAVREFETYLRRRKTTLKSAGVDVLRDYLSLLIEEDKNSRDRLIAIARYCYVARRNDLYIYFAGLLGASDVLPAIGQRLGPRWPARPPSGGSLMTWRCRPWVRRRTATRS